MKIDIKIKNLGKIKSATIKVRPITLLTGPNGTGKSFFTKSFYSILNVVNKNVHFASLEKNINLVKIRLDGFLSKLSHAGDYDYTIINSIKQNLDKILRNIETSSELDLSEYLIFTNNSTAELNHISSTFEEYLENLSKKPKKFQSIQTFVKNINSGFSHLKSTLSDSRNNYAEALTENLKNEIKENFQVSDLQELVSFGHDAAEISIDGLMEIKIQKSGIKFNLLEKFINEVSSLSRVVFFESPAYWKVRDALKSANTFPVFLRREANNTLTGVPKYFYDLDDALKTGTKDNYDEKLDQLSTSIKSELGGEFVFKGDTLVFKDTETGREISKNLISFGMTNLGIIHTLLKNNVISHGSFVFIDEPETNLHPKWQVLLMNLLIKLAEHNVNIVIATHSIDMLKALEIGLSKTNTETNNDLMSIHYLDTDGELLEFESKDSIGQLKEARSELNASYESLYFEGSN